jgi:PDZ domain
MPLGRSALLLALPILALGLMAQAKQTNQQKPAGGEAKSAAARPTPQPPSPYSPRFAFGGNAAEIPATFSEDLVFLPVNVNESEPSLFVLDTAASATSIDPRRAQEVEVNTNQPLGLVLPSVMFPLASLPELARNNFSADTGRRYEGTIGNDVLSRAVVAIDYARETVRIFDPNIYKYEGHGSAFPLSFGAGMPLIRARIDNPKGKQLEGDFGINTTLIAGIVVSRKFSDAHHLFRSKGKIATAYDPQLTGGENVSLFRLRYFKIGGSAADDTIAEVSSSKMAETDDPKLAGVIGARLLRRFNVVLDYPHRQIIFEPNSNFKNYDEEDKSGIALEASGPGWKTLEVAHVVPKSPAADAGIRTGDVIAGIDGEAAADISLASAREMFRQVGHKYKLLIQRGEQTKEVTIQMERLVQ